MGLFGSLYSSTSGMLAASRATQVTSTNVANMTTTGFKKSDVAFADLVNSSKYSSTIDATGGVTSERLLRATQQGQIQQTGSVTDASISGNGFFAVKSSLDPDAQFYYTRNGQFNADVVRTTPDSDPFTTENTGEESYLRNSAGFYLYGWPTDTDGVTLGGSTELSSLQPVEIGLLQTQSIPTNRIDLSVNLNSEETDINPHLLATAQTLPVNTQAADFSRSVTVYDGLGAPRDVEFQFRKITGPMAQFTSNSSVPLQTSDVLVDNPTGPTPGIVNGDTLEITNGGGTLTVTFVNGPADTSLNQANTLADLQDVINNYQDAATMETQFEARIGDTGGLLVVSQQQGESLDITGSSANVLGATGLNFVTDPVDGDYNYDPFYDTTMTADPLGPYPDQGDFPALENVPNTQGWWEVSIQIPDPAAPNSGASVELKRGLLNFNGDGTLNAQDGTAIIDLTTTPIDFDLGVVGEELAVNVDIERFSQFAGDYNVIQADQNGTPLGERIGVSIQRNGLVVADFSNGNQVPIYRIPVATFTNPDGLSAESGTVFSQTPDAGEVLLYEAGTNGAGIINGSTLEGSNVDISEEFGDLIVHQRAFGLNSQVINAVDEMTENLVRLKR